MLESDFDPRNTKHKLEYKYLDRKQPRNLDTTPWTPVSTDKRTDHDRDIITNEIEDTTVNVIEDKVNKNDPHFVHYQEDNNER